MNDRLLVLGKVGTNELFSSRYPPGNLSAIGLRGFISFISTAHIWATLGNDPAECGKRSTLAGGQEEVGPRNAPLPRWTFNLPPLRAVATSDAYLIEAVRDGDQTALGRLYDAYGAALNGVILRMVQKEELAQEVLQDTFVKIWRNAAGYDPAKGRPFTWMLNIARNAAIDLLRTAAVKNAGSIRSLDKTVYGIGHDNLRDDLDVADVRDVVGKLKPEHRELIEMAYYKGYSQQEIAVDTGLPLGTVKSRTRAALLELRTQLKDHR